MDFDRFYPKRRWTDGDYGGVAGQNDEPTIQEAAQGTGRRTGASRRDHCASRAPRIGVPRAKCPFSWAFEDGGGATDFGTRMFAKPPAARLRTSTTMQWAVHKTVTTW